MPHTDRRPARRTPSRPAPARTRRRARRRLGPLCLLALAAGAAACLLLARALDGGRPAASGAGASAVPVAAPERDGLVVAVDPGHGGGDGGAEGLGFEEEEMTLATALDLMELLQADDRFAPFLTTRQEELLKPSERAAIANAGGAQLVLSIHGNSDPVYGSRGFECYAVPPGLTNHEQSLRFAQLLAQAFSAAGEPLRGEDGVRYLFYDGNNNKVIFESFDTTVRSMPTFTLLEDSACPAVLAEQCFITNSEDVAAFAGEDGCRAAAQLYYRAICGWFEIEPLALS